jgi:starch-binding outer membrane protein, SusD/RagB family
MRTIIAATRRGRSHRTGLRLAAFMAGALVLGGCQDLDIVNTNAPTAETLTDSPTRDVLALAATGIFFQAFNDVGTEINMYALYGREGYNLLGNDPRETGEQIRGPQDPTGRNALAWTPKYSAMRTINTYLEALPRATGLTDAEVRASQGFAKTVKAWHIHRLAVRTGNLGIPLDVDRPITAEPAPFVTFTGAMEAASALMDDAFADLQAGGGAFPFAVAPGYAGFDTPAQFARFNRALAAKILVHRATFVECEPCWNLAATALAQSFVTDQGLPESLDLGVEYHISTATGIPANPVSEPLTNERLWVHASIVDGAQLRQDGSPDLRLTRKVIDAGRTNELEDLVGRYKPILYNQPGNPAAANLAAPIPWISNEELLLLRAETRWHTGDRQGALGDIDLVRIHSGGLPTTTLTPGASTEDFVTELLYNRVYSLMWAQGTRWIDARRYNRLGTLPIDRPGDSVFENMLVPADECAARSLSPPCTPL